MGRVLIISGVVLIVLGVLFVVLEKMGLSARFPGDVFIQKEGFALYFPVGICIFVSLFLSVLAFLFSKK